MKTKETKGVGTKQKVGGGIGGGVGVGWGGVDG